MDRAQRIFYWLHFFWDKWYGTLVIVPSLLGLLGKGVKSIYDTIEARDKYRDRRRNGQMGKVERRMEEAEEAARKEHRVNLVFEEVFYIESLPDLDPLLIREVLRRRVKMNASYPNTGRWKRGW